MQQLHRDKLKMLQSYTRLHAQLVTCCCGNRNKKDPRTSQSTDETPLAGLPCTRSRRYNVDVNYEGTCANERNVKTDLNNERKSENAKDKTEKQLRQELLLVNTRMWDVGFVQKQGTGALFTPTVPTHTRSHTHGAVPPPPVFHSDISPAQWGRRYTSGPGAQRLRDGRGSKKKAFAGWQQPRRETQRRPSAGGGPKTAGCRQRVREGGKREAVTWNVEC